MSGLQLMLNFNPVDPPSQTGVSSGDEIPKDLDIFYRAESSFLPPGKKFSDLTEQEITEIKNRYRFDPLRPGIYQGITGLNNSI